MTRQGKNSHAQNAVMLKDVTVAYDRIPAIHHISGKFPKGSLTAVVGPNGAGKSTLLKAIVGILHPSEGEILVDGGASSPIGFLPQQAAIDRSFPINVKDTVAIGLWHQCGAMRGMGASQSKQITEALLAVGIEHLGERAVGTLSAGQFQRVLFARLLVQNSPLILLDEPFAAIDERTIEDLLEIVHQWHRAGRTIIAVLHEFDQVEAHFPQTLLIARELVAWGLTADVMTPDKLKKARQMAYSWHEYSQSGLVLHQPHG